MKDVKQKEMFCNVVPFLPADLDSNAEKACMRQAGAVRQVQGQVGRKRQCHRNPGEHLSNADVSEV